MLLDHTSFLIASVANSHRDQENGAKRELKYTDIDNLAEGLGRIFFWLRKHERSQDVVLAG